MARRAFHTLPIAVATAMAGTILVPSINVPESAELDAHRTIVLVDGSYRFDAADGPEVLEDVSDHCLDCHGGGDRNRTAEAPKPKHLVAGLGRSHPVDVSYPTDDPSYTPVAALDKRLVLHHGRMTCLTCHSVGAGRELVITQERSRLCVACHFK